MNTQIPDKFSSRTMFNPKLMIIHVDVLKDICKELQDQITTLNQRITDLEGNIAKKTDEKISTKAKS